MNARRSAAALVRLAWSRFRRTPTDEPSVRLDYAGLVHEVESGLHEIDFAEVTTEDRATFVEHAVVWQIRRALHAGRFELALELQRYGVGRIAQLNAAAIPEPGLKIVPAPRAGISVRI
jgi:hypothetical protein